MYLRFDLFMLLLQGKFKKPKVEVVKKKLFLLLIMTGLEEISKI